MKYKIKPSHLKRKALIPDRQIKKDFWDKLSACTPLLIGLLVTGLGGIFTNIYNSRQLQLNQIQALDKLRPQLASDDPQEREFAYSSFIALGYQNLAVRLIALQRDPTGRTVLSQLASTGSDEIRNNAATALKVLDNSPKRINILMVKPIQGANAIRKVDVVPPLAPLATNLNISEGRKRIVREIVGGILGINFVTNANSLELINAFSKVSADINSMRYSPTYGLNGGAMTGLRSVDIIDRDDQLTLFGVSIFKSIANELTTKDKVQTMP